MFNCYRVFHNGRLVAIVPNEDAGFVYIGMNAMLTGENPGDQDWKVVGAYIDGAGF